MTHADTALPVSLDRAAVTPLAVQLADALREAAASGHLRGGDRLPSTRALAGRLGVSRTVTSAAYEQLHAEGWIAGRHGSGTYVTMPPSFSASEVPAPAVPAPEADAPALLDLGPGTPWADGLDRAAWRRAWRAAADPDPLVRAHRAGLPEYRAAVSEHLLRHRGLAAGSVLATGGTTAAVIELAAAVLERGDVVAVEEPGYQRAVQAFRRAGLRVVGVPVDDEGLRPSAIPAGTRAVYCSPAHQYPMGSRLSAARRVSLVELARSSSMLVIEDDYDGELRFDVAPLPMLASLAPDVVVHLGTTSKILTPTLGAGWMVAPEAITSAVLAYRDSTGTRPSPAGQRVLYEFARNGDLGRHLRKLRREMAERRTLLAGALSSAGIPIRGDDAGAHLVVPFSSASVEASVIAAAERRGIRLDGLARHFAGEPSAHGVAIGYAGCSREALVAALPALVSLLRGQSLPS